MYCIKCGVQLADTEHQCPLCRTVAFHPDIQRQVTEPLYPSERYPHRRLRPSGWLFFASVIFLLPMLVTLVCDLHISDRITWSGYVVGALLTGYAACVLPFWFRKPNPIIFVPIGFAALEGYLLYINEATSGDWFLSFAFPVVGIIGLITTAIVTVVRCLKKGHFYIYGGGLIAYGGFMMLLEFFIHITFHRPMLYWSILPMAVFCLMGMFLISLAISRPMRDKLAKKLFF